MLKLDRLCHRNRPRLFPLRPGRLGRLPQVPHHLRPLLYPPLRLLSLYPSLCAPTHRFGHCTFLPSYLGRFFTVHRSLAHTGTSYGRLVTHSADSLISLPLLSYRAFFVHSFEGISGLVWFWDTLVVLGCVCDHSVDLCFASAIQVCPPCSVVPPHCPEDAYLKICLCCTSYSLGPRFGALLQ